MRITYNSDEGVVILAGGLTIHTFRETNAWDPKTAPQGFKDFELAVVDSVNDVSSVQERNEKMKALTKHPFFRRAHPREEHFVPIYIAAGAGSGDGESAIVLADVHSAISSAFGV
jgi:aromatic ring-opening dioxygenase catalytic subunit (LigB family)